MKSHSVALGVILQALPVLSFRSQLWANQSRSSPCPDSLAHLGYTPGNWTFFHDVERVLECQDKASLLYYNYLTPLNFSTSRRSVFAAAVETANLSTPFLAAELGATNASIDLEVGWREGGGPGTPAEIAQALSSVQVFLASNSNENETAFLAHYGNTSIGIWSGAGVSNGGLASTVIQDFLAQAAKHETAGTLLLQWCGAKQTADITLGIAADVGGGLTGLARVQAAVTDWSHGQCVNDPDGSSVLPDRPVWLMPMGSNVLKFLHVNSSDTINATSTDNATTALNTTGSWHATRTIPRRGLAVDAASASCTTVVVVSGDLCGTLASKCGIAENTFLSYNGATLTSPFCTNLAIGQRVCCSAGTLPTPTPSADGSCATYTIKSGDSCSSIAGQFSVTQDNLNKWNTNTWAWTTCSSTTYIDAGETICVSSGSPPMPAPITNSVCGPQVPGTTRPSGSFNMSMLNPCPLNACCDIWGQCGTTAEFCTDTRGSGAPGTAAKGSNGCISNCGTLIVTGSAPTQFRTIGYFEAWNQQRPCLWMDARQLDATAYTHVHFAFARLTSDFAVDVAYIQQQFDAFKAMTGFKKILSFGGWSDSTDASTFMNMRNAVSAANRLTAAENIANFIKANGLDGVDIDWEYPGEPDIDLATIPPDSADDGENYLTFLQVLRALLPSGTSLSIAAPASYWYLRFFPIGKISSVVDYVIYMTYDLHGQWDYNNKWSDPGCPGGNCLRSHVNLTETMNALSMITKAGVPSNKVVVGVASYGRSFKMTDASCAGPECTFLGPDSQAQPGPCTQTAGYISNAEINGILATDSSARHYTDDSGSDIVIYGGTQWVAYMSESTKAGRIGIYESYTLGGTTEWAVDLAAFQSAEGMTDRIFKQLEQGSCTWRFPAVDCLNPFADEPESYTPSQRWEGLNADCAWREFVGNWTAVEANPPLDFSLFMEAYFNADEKAECSQLEDPNPCAQTYDCKTFQTINSGPAGWVIIESIGYIYSTFWSFHAALQSAQTDINTMQSAIQDTFYPHESDIGKIISDLAGLAFAFVAPALFKNIIKVGDVGKDTGLASYPWLIAIVMDFIGSPGGKSELGSTILSLFKAWDSSVDLALGLLFSGNSTGLPMLSGMIAEGSQIEGIGMIAQVPQSTMVTIIEKALAATIIESVWQSIGYNPVVTSTGVGCDGGGSAIYGKHMSGPQADDASACYNGELYYIIAAYGEYTADDFCECTSYCQEEPLCEQQFTPLPGIGELADASKWFGVDKVAIVRWAIATHNSGGGSLADKLTDPTAYENLSNNVGGKGSLLSDDAPGIITFPVCSFSEALNNWQTGWADPWDNFPCNKLS